MASLSPGELKAVLDNAPSSSTMPQAAPWTAPTADRLLRTTAVPCVLQHYGGSGVWNQNTAAFSAVSPPDPTTGQQYFCLIGSGLQSCGLRYDFGLNLAAVPGAHASAPGIFSAVPAAPGFEAYTGWAYVIDTATGAHYFLCGASWNEAATPNSFHYVCLTQPAGLFGPPQMSQYLPKSGVVQPHGLWSTGETIWFTNGDGTLWQVALADVLTNTSSSLQQVTSTGVVQAVISDGSAVPTYYVLSAVANDSDGYDLIEFVAGNPSGAVTIESGYTLNGIKTTPDGAVWKVVSDLSQADVQQPKSQFAYLVPPFPARGLNPTWTDPLANADPSLLPTGLTDTIMDAVPLSATNVLLCTSANASTYFLNDIDPTNNWLLTRVGIGVFDQPAVPFPSYSGDAAQAYTQISQDLIATESGSYDIRAQYPAIQAAQAAAYYAKVIALSPPSDFPDPAAWTAVQNDLTTELYNLVSTLSFWEATAALASLQNQIKSLAVTYVSNSLAIPTTATPLNSDAGQVNALNIAGFTMGSGGTILTATAAILAVTSPVGAALVGVLSAGAALVSLFMSFLGSKETNFVINVSDPMYYISARLGDIDGVLGQLFTQTLTTIDDYSQASAKDAGILSTVSGLVRNQTWLNSPPVLEPGSTQPPSAFEQYYQGCVVSFLQAFVPLVTAANVTIINLPNPSWPTYKGKPVYVSPTHTFWNTMGDEYQCALLQYASSHDQSKPLGQDLDALLFTTWNIPVQEVFLSWGIPAKPSWIT